MPTTIRLTLGALVVATDGVCGLVKSLLVDPTVQRVVHLVVEPEHRIGLARLVPVELLSGTEADADNGVELSCELAAVEALPMAEASEVVRGVGVGYVYVHGPAPLVREVHELVPKGEGSLTPGTPVMARDGELGKVAGFDVDNQHHQIVSLLVSEGRFPWGHKTAALPITCMASLGTRVELNMTIAEATRLASSQRR